MIRCLVIVVISRVVLYPSLGQEQLSPTPREERIEDGQVEANPQRVETELILNTLAMVHLDTLILLAIRLIGLVCFSYRFFAFSKDFNLRFIMLLAMLKTIMREHCVQGFW